MKNRLEQLRLQRSLTQQELADRVEVSRQTVISLERGRYNPSIILAFRLARLFDLRIEDIFLYEGDHDG
jgi:putative transcriptional regulator